MTFYSVTMFTTISGVKTADWQQSIKGIVLSKLYTGVCSWELKTIKMIMPRISLTLNKLTLRKMRNRHTWSPDLSLDQAKMTSASVVWFTFFILFLKLYVRRNFYVEEEFEYPFSHHTICVLKLLRLNSNIFWCL